MSAENTLVTDPLLSDETFGKKADAMNNALLSIAASLRGENWVTNFESIKQLVRSGARPIPIGSESRISRTTSINATVVSGSHITGVTVNDAKFVGAYGTFTGYLALTYDGTAWVDDTSKQYDLPTYGITITGTPQENDGISITSTASAFDVQILDYDHDVPENPNIEHSMTMGCQDCVTYGSIPFCTTQAIFYVDAADYPNGLPAGTYAIQLDHGAYGSGTAEDGIYEFTTTQIIPVGGQIKHTTMGVYRSGGYGTQYVVAGKFNTYASPDATSKLESNLETRLVSSTTGTLLGKTTASNPTYKTTDKLNFTERNAYGSNNWEYSDARQWLNSRAAKGVGWWVALTPFSRVPSANKTMAGFLAGFDDAFCDAIIPTKHKYQKSIADGYGLGETVDKVFLLSRTEIFGGIERSADGAEGSVYPPYQQFSDLSSAGTGADTNRIKYFSGTARYWWLRGAGPSYASYVRFVSPSGSVNGDGARSTSGLAPAWVIG